MRVCVCVCIGEEKNMHTKLFHLIKMQPGVIYERDHSLSFRSIHEFCKTIKSTTITAPKTPRERVKHRIERRRVFDIAWALWLHGIYGF